MLFDFPLIQSSEYLLQPLVGMWRPLNGSIDMEGELLSLDQQEIYFLIGLPIRGILKVTHLSMRGAWVADQYWEGHITRKWDGSDVLAKIEDLTIWEVTSMVV